MLPKLFNILKKNISAGNPREAGGQLFVIPSVDYPWKRSNLGLTFLCTQGLQLFLSLFYSCV